MFALVIGVVLLDIKYRTRMTDVYPSPPFVVAVTALVYIGGQNAAIKLSKEKESLHIILAARPRHCRKVATCEPRC